MPHPLIEGTHYLAFDSLDELRALLDESYHHPDEADEMRAAGHAFARQFHSARARAVYLLMTLAECGFLDLDWTKVAAGARANGTNG